MVQKNKWFTYLNFTIEVGKELLLLTANILWSILTVFLPKKRKNIAGQLALVTGGSEGVGRGIAFELARNGCNIAIANRNMEKGEQTAEEIRKKFNVEAKAFKCDVAKHEDLKKLRIAIKDSMGTVDILVNNAGLLMLHNSLLEGDDEAYQYAVDVNLTSYFWATRAFLPDMIKQRRGHIVSMCSTSVQNPIPSAITYVTTKFGNRGFMDALREELCFYGFDKYIKTSVAHPEVIKTNDEMCRLMAYYLHEPLLQLVDLEVASRAIVDGILQDKHTIHVSYVTAAQNYFLNALPQHAKTRIFKKFMKSERQDEFIEMRLKNNGLFEYYVKE